MNYVPIQFSQIKFSHNPLGKSSFGDHEILCFHDYYRLGKFSLNFIKLVDTFVSRNWLKLLSTESRNFYIILITGQTTVDQPKLWRPRFICNSFHKISKQFPVIKKRNRLKQLSKVTISVPRESKKWFKPCLPFEFPQTNFVTNSIHKFSSNSLS